MFEAEDWYWIVAGDESRLYSSKVGDYVLPSDDGYRTFLADGKMPTRIADEAELGEVLAPFNLRPSPGGILDGFRERHARETILSAAFKIAFNHENRLRAIERALSLNGSPEALTPAQAKAAVKALM